MKLVRVGGVHETVSTRGATSFAFGNSSTSCKLVRVSCLAVLGSNNAGEAIFFSGELPAAIRAARVNATPPKTVRANRGKRRRCMMLSRKKNLLPRNTKLRQDFFEDLNH